jgi:bacteriocin biosynthesis cyclodehydratase domain-containing protein
MKLPERPLLAPWYRLVEDGDRLLLEHGRVVVVLEGGAVRTLLPALLPLLDGSRTVDELCARLGAAVRPAVEQSLELLAQNGLLVEGGGGAVIGRPGAEAAALAAAYRLAPGVAAARLASAAVGVAGGSRTADDVARLLHRAGVGTVSKLGWRPSESVDLAVVAPAPAETGNVEEWNAYAAERGLRWLGVRPFDGHALTVGPLVVPGESACHSCLLLRLAAHVEYRSDFARIERAAVSVEAGAALEAVAAGVAAQLVVCWVAGRAPRLPGVLHVLELGPPMALSQHTVLRVPRCPACSPARRLAPRVPWHEAAAA